MTQMEDWLGIVLGILFILGPALLEKGNRKKKRGQRRERQLPQEAYGPEPVLRSEMTESQLSEVRPVYVPVLSEEPMTFPEETVSSEPVARESAASDRAVPVPDRGNNPPARRKRRFNGRDMIIYSEILKPKF